MNPDNTSGVENTIPETNAGNDPLKKYKVLLAGSILILIVTVIISYFVRQGATDEATRLAELREVATENWSEKATDSTTENLNSYVTDIDTQLESDVAIPAEKKSLLLRKAIALGTNRVDLQSPDMENLDESTTILRSLFEAPSESYPEDIAKYGTISAYIGLLNSTCFRPEIATTYPSQYPGLYQSLLTAGMHPRAALLLVTHAFAYNELDERFDLDASTIAYRSYITALYLYSFGNKFDSIITDDSLKSDQLFAKLKDDYAKRDELERILYTGAYRGTVDPALRLAFVNDIVSTYGRQYVYGAESEAIDAGYEKAYEVIDSYRNTDDQVSDAVSRVMNTLMYFDSLHVRFQPIDIDETLSDRLVTTFIENARSSKELQQMVKTYFTIDPNEGDWLAVRSGFMKAAAHYPKLREFFSTDLGIDLPPPTDDQ